MSPLKKPLALLNNNSYNGTIVIKMNDGEIKQVVSSLKNIGNAVVLLEEALKEMKGIQEKPNKEEKYG